MSKVRDTSAASMTSAQQLIFTGQQVFPDEPLYNMVMVFRIHGPIQVEAFARAFEILIGTTDSLRTVIVSGSDGPTRQTIDGLPAELIHRDFSGDVAPEESFERWVTADASGVFDLSERLFRSALVKLAEDDFAWYLNQHHLITDGWSTAVVYQRMEQLYRDATAGTLGEYSFPQFEAYVEYERGQGKTNAARALSIHEEAREPQPLRLYGSTPSAAATTKTKRLTHELGRTRTERVRQMAVDRGSELTAPLTEFSIFATTLFALLWRISGQADLGLLTPTHNRNSKQFKETAGLFMEVLPLHVSVDFDDTFGTLLSTVEGAARRLLTQSGPGSSTAELNRSHSVLLNYINASLSDFAGWPMTSEWVHPGHGDVDHSLRVQIHDFDGTGNLMLHFDVSQDIFTEVTEAALIRHFDRLLDALLTDLASEIAGVSLVDDEEAALFDRTFTGRGVVVGVGSVVEGFVGRVGVDGSGVALVDLGVGVSYGGLDGWSDGLAARFVEAAGGGRPRVGLVMGRSGALVASVLGVLKAGGCYVPVDVSYPAERVRFLLDDGGVDLVATTPDLAGEMAGVADACGVGLVVVDPEPLERPAGGFAVVDVSGDDLAYIMYTSGSTGTPKGVAVTHRGLTNYLEWARDLYAGDDPISLPLYSSFGFDLTVTSLFLPLLTGGRIVVYPQASHQHDLSILDVFEDDQVDAVKLTPSHLALLQPDHLQTERIRTLIVGGEDLTTALAHHVHTVSGGNLTIYNEYGPTEATVACMAHTYDPETDTASSVPLGTPAHNTQILLLDQHDQPVPPHIPGEICVTGPNLAAGYHNNPEQTAEKFTPHPTRPNETIYHTGDLATWTTPDTITYHSRTDNQLKIRGHRIEPTEIENTLTQHPNITQAVIDIVDDLSISNTSSLESCVRCGLSARHPDARINDEGTCAPCIFYDAHRQDAARYFGTTEGLSSTLAGGGNGTHDCVMLLSGGKDSTYALYQLAEMGYNVLAFSFDNGYISEEAKANVRRACDHLGIELVVDTVSSMGRIFADSLAQFSNVCQGCFKTIYTRGMSLALDRGIRNVVTGLSRGQIFETRLADLFRIGITDPEAVDQAIVDARRAYHQMDDVVAECIDTSAFKEATVFDELRIVDFYRYHDAGLDHVYEFLSERAPWVRPSDTGRSTNCLINNTGIFVHQRERGYHNYALPYSWDVRLGHKTRESALTELDDDIDENEVAHILREVGYELAPVRQEGSGRRLVAYYTSDTADLTVDEAREHVAATLPPALVPTYFEPLDAIPLTSNGKIDRARLPRPGRRVKLTNSAYVSPRTPSELMLADIWRQVLGLDEIGVHDQFIQLGGDSILNIQVVSLAAARGLSITPRQLFENDTIAELASVVTAQPVPVEMSRPSASGIDYQHSGLDAEELDRLLDELNGSE